MAESASVRVYARFRPLNSREQALDVGTHEYTDNFLQLNGGVVKMLTTIKVHSTAAHSRILCIE